MNWARQGRSVKLGLFVPEGGVGIGITRGWGMYPPFHVLWLSQIVVFVLLSNLMF
jgi:hypothetical protein